MTKYLDLYAAFEKQVERERNHWKMLEQGVEEIIKGFSAYLEIPERPGEQYRYATPTIHGGSERQGRKLALKICLLLDERYKESVPPRTLVFERVIEFRNRKFYVGKGNPEMAKPFEVGGGFDSLYPEFMDEAHKQLEYRPDS